MQRQESLETFKMTTGSNIQVAESYLNKTGWDLQEAVELFFAEQAQKQPQVESKPIATSSQKSSKIKTFSDWKSGQEEDQEHTYFAGGEKSGVLMSGGPKDSNDIVKDILEIAAKNGPMADEEPVEPSKNFKGAGYRLGNEQQASVPSVPAVHEVQDSGANVAERFLTFWKDGFSIDDGPLQHYDDPQNVEFLESIKNGIAPMKYLNVKPGEKVEVKVAHKMDQQYEPPPKKPTVPFSGQGNRLGSVTVSKASSSKVEEPVKFSEWSVDSNLPMTSIQIRMADGTRMVLKCNHTHTIGDIRSFIISSRPGESMRSFTLSTMHPVQLLQDLKQTVKDAGLLNSVIVQRYN